MSEDIIVKKIYQLLFYVIICKHRNCSKKLLYEIFFTIKYIYIKLDVSTFTVRRNFMIKFITYNSCFEF